MQVVSGPIGAPTVHFEAPPSKQVPAQMKRFVSWFNRTAPGSKEPLPAITRAGTAHLFLSRSIPLKTAMDESGVLSLKRQWPRASASRCSSLWRRLSWPTKRAITRPLKSQPAERHHPMADLVRLNRVARAVPQHRASGIPHRQGEVIDRLRGQINERQQKAIVRIFSEGREGFKGGLSAGNYSTITGASPATTTRDLADLIEKGALIRTGERKHARYALNLTAG